MFLSGVWQDHWWCGSLLWKHCARWTEVAKNRSAVAMVCVWYNVGLNWCSCSERLNEKKSPNKKQITKELIKQMHVFHFNPLNTPIKPCRLFIAVLLQHTWFYSFLNYILWIYSGTISEFHRVLEKNQQKGLHNLFCQQSSASFRKCIN